MKIAILTGGGDCPGLNAAIRAVVRRAGVYGDQVYGIREGWKGLLEGQCERLTRDQITGILPLGGTILGTSRINPLKVKGGLKRSLRFFRRRGWKALIAVGGEGTTKIAAAYWRAGLPVVCIPKTIDNDTWGTDYTIGFDTAVQIATEAIDRLHTTAESHHRVMIVELMGRHAGWIATYAGIAGGADAILVPEEAFPIRELCQIIKSREKKRKRFSIIVMAEDSRILLENGQILRTPLHHDEYGDVKLGGIGEMLGKELRKRTQREIRVTVLGHVQRGGTPTAFDRILASRLGIFAVDCVKQKEFGVMVALQGGKLRTVPLETVTKKLKKVDEKTLEAARVFFG